MLAAELYGKLSPAKPPHERMEDVLTSYVFSMFRYLNDPVVPLAFLNEAENLRGQNLVFSGVTDASVFFWPRFSFGTGKSREADAVLVLSKSEGSKVAILVEAKYESGLSNLPGNVATLDYFRDVQDAGSLQLGHQLADEFCGIQCATSWGAEVRRELEHADRKLLLYLTANHVIPKPQLQEAVGEIRKRPCCTPECEAGAESDIYWLSWRHLHRILSDNNLFGTYTLAERNLFHDLRSVLEQRGLEWFSPFGDLISVEPYPAFYKHNFWLGLQPVEGYEPIFCG